ncbi:hypothetical protein DL93DRAFT_2075063 [Clavulina sp. PMI_390]|nr:hypothetical protein DL93DRAFT_2075063 [Clavulina sp. PMI_390]
MGASASYDDHVNRALNAPPQSMLAATNVNAHSPSSVDARMVGFSASGFAAASSLSTSSSSSSSSTSNSLSTSSSSNPSPYSTYSSYSSMPIPQNNAAQTSYVFTDFRAEVERYRSEEEDLDFPVLRKGRDPRGGWPGL